MTTTTTAVSADINVSDAAGELIPSVPVDRALVDRLVQEKLDAMAAEIQAGEGWTWSMGRPAVINRYGEDALVYRLVAVTPHIQTGRSFITAKLSTETAGQGTPVRYRSNKVFPDKKHFVIVFLIRKQGGRA